MRGVVANISCKCKRTALVFFVGVVFVLEERSCYGRGPPA
jgi:hypothetical protein